MQTTKRRLLSIAVLALILVTLATVCSHAASADVKIKDYNYPGNLTAGSSYNIKGTITSNETIERVEIGVVNKSTKKWTEQKYDNNKVNAKSFDIKRADSSIYFSKLPAGTYYYRIYAHTKSGVTTLLNEEFTVKANKSAAKVTISGYNYPTSFTQGGGITIKGTISSTKTIKRVEIGVVDKNSGKWTSVKYDNKKVNAKSFNVNKADSKIQFGQLKAGTYYYRIYAHTADGAALLVNKQFTVNSKTAKKTTAKASVSAAATNNTNTSAVGTPSNSVTVDGIKLTDYNYPGNYKSGTSFNIKGTITSPDPITRIEVGMVFEDTNKWTSYKYDNSNVNSKTFDLKTADPGLYFSKLPGGKYYYRIYVHTSKGVTVLLNKEFTVTSTSKAMAAVEWARMIADDNSFTYGKGQATHEIGCYFCGTNQKKKPKGYEKTYVCITFTGAAFTHGAGDKDLLAREKAGKMTMYGDDRNFTELKCWKKIGTCDKLSLKDLKAGDVVIKYGPSGNCHSWIYGGGDEIIEAGYEGWGAGTISRHSGAADRLKSYGTKGTKNYVMRYIG